MENTQVPLSGLSGYEYQHYPVPMMFEEADFPPLGSNLWENLDLGQPFPASGDDAEAALVSVRGNLRIMNGETNNDINPGMESTRMNENDICEEVWRLEAALQDVDAADPVMANEELNRLEACDLEDFLDRLWSDDSVSHVTFTVPENIHANDNAAAEDTTECNRVDAATDIQLGMGDPSPQPSKLEDKTECPRCYKTFRDRHNLKVHLKNVKCEKKMRLHCAICRKVFHCESKRSRHEKTCKIKTNQCTKCFKCFSNNSNRKRHEKICGGLPIYTCSRCGEVFQREENRQNHESMCQPVVYTFVCGVCSAECETFEQLQEHCKSAHPAPPSPDSDDDRQRAPSQDAPKRPVTCRTCLHVCGDMSELYRHRMTQHGGADDAPVQFPWGGDPAPWENEDREVVDPNLQQIYEENRSHIFSQHREGKTRKDYHFPSNDIQGGVNEIMDNAQRIYRAETRAFRLQLAFGMILRNNRDGRYRYYIAYDNSHMFDRPVTVSKPGDMVRLRARVRHLNLDEYLREQRPNTSWRVVMITDMMFSIFRTNFILGKGNLPDFIKRSRSIIGLDANKQYEPYQDNLCAFRCMAKHFNQIHMEEAIDIYYQQWREYIKETCILSEDPKKFHGLDMNHMPDFEGCFKICINIYELQESGTVIPRYLSQAAYDTVLYMNIHDHHLSYVSNFKAYANKFQCALCSRHFERSDCIKKHLKVCKNKTKYKMPGGYYKMAKTIFQELDELDICVPKEDRFYPWFAVFDMEALLLRVDEQNSPKLVWKQKHVAISTSVCSNIPEYESPHFIVNTDEDQLIKLMVTKLLEMCEAAHTLAKAKWGGALADLTELMKVWKPQTDSTDATGDDDDDNDDDDDEDDSEAELDDFQAAKLFKDAMGRPNSFRKFCQALDSDESEDEVEIEESGERLDESPDLSRVSEKGKQLMYKHLSRVKGRLMTYMRQLPVLGFNSSNYDLNLIKSKLFHHLQTVTCEGIDFVVKKNNKYSCIATPDFKFLDIMQFLAPNCSYSKFLSAFKVEEQKSYFCYDWFNDASKLDVKELPPYDAFYSELRQGNVLEEEHKAWEKRDPVERKDEPKTGKKKYEDLRNIWKDRNMATFKDYLEYYNHADSKPFVTAVKKLQEYYIKNDLDLFKIAVSVPGLARRILFDVARENNNVFSLFDRDNEDLYWTVQKNLVGGPSVIFTRKHKVDETFIRNQLDKLCQTLEGYDSNSLYLNAISQMMPTGMYVRRLEERGFAPTLNEKYVSMYVWMEWVARTRGIRIEHKLNSGKELRVGGYLADGYSASNHTIWEYFGCLWHAHDCVLTKDIKNKKWRETREAKFKATQQRTAFLKSRGYNVVEQWECEFEITRLLDPVVKKIEAELFPKFYTNHRGGVDYREILDGVVSEELYGMVEVDISVPKRWPAGREKELSPFDYFSEMSPIFCTTDVPMDVIGDHMREHIREHDLSDKPRRLLVGGMSAKKVLLPTPLLKWYLDHCLDVTRIYQVVEYVPKRCFKTFEESVSDARREGDRDSDKEVLSDTSKLIGNSAYGSLIMDRTKHRNINYLTGESKARFAVNDPRFIKLTELDHDMYEVEMAKRTIKLDLPIQLGFFILGYAKLRMLQFHYQCVDTYVSRNDYALLEIDTDSWYAAFSHKSFEDAVRPEKKEEFRDVIYNRCDDRVIEADLTYWFPRKCCTKHANHDRRTSSLFKLEESGTEMVALSSKTYVLKTYKDTNKVSCKGVIKKNLENELELYHSVLDTQQSQSGVNRGFRVREDGVHTYEQSRNGFAYLYCKRKVLDDGINTLPLDLTLTPWTKYDTYVVEGFHPLSTLNTCALRKHGESFNSVEHLFQYERAQFHKRKGLKQAILKADCGVTAAKLGHQIDNQPEGFDVRDKIMIDILYLKKEHDYEVRQCLEESMDQTIVCVDKYKKYWCNGLTSRLTPMFEPKKYPGQNRLGLLWMEIRSARRDEMVE